MVKFLFLQDIIFEFHGIMNLSSTLKKAGHECDLLIWTQEKNFLEKVKEINPDIIAFSVTTESYKKAIQIANEIKEKIKVISLFGGPHPTYFPEMINEKGVDIISRGEAEEAVLELADNLKNSKSINDVKNLWVKDESGKIYKNDFRPLLQDLDKLEFPDREIYYKRYKFLKKLPIKRFLTSRGCPWNCSFCYNSLIKEFYKGKGTYLRKRSPDNCIEEIVLVKEKYPLRVIRFFDETFTYNKKWLKEFLPQLKKRVNLPISFLARANELDEETVKMLKECNCECIFMGVETGNEVLRNKLLNKHLSNESILNAAKLLKKYNIKFGTYNIFVLPDETLDNALETLYLNAKIKPNYPLSTLYVPYPKTQLTNYAIEENLIPKAFNIGDENILNLKDKTKILNLHELFYWGVKFPFLIPFIKKMICLPPNKIYKLAYKVSAMISSGKSFGANLIEMFKLAWKLKENRPD
tara:strand:- start:160 stop:1560 length:1401 start_codon:yes stop_codon:yes gene_type:complete